MLFNYLVVFTGIFAPLSKITKTSILNKPSTTHPPLRQSLSFGKVNTSRVTAKVDTGKFFLYKILSNAVLKVRKFTFLIIKLQVSIDVVVDKML